VSRPRPLSPTEAYQAIQKLLELRDSISFTEHARRRARERNFTVDDIRRVLINGAVSPRPHWDERYRNWTYTVSGVDYDNVPLVIVIALEPALGRITIITGKDD
jgi:hypothetical protein